MSSPTSKVSVKKSVAFMAVGLLVFILYLYFFIGFDEILAVIRQVDPVKYALYYSVTFAAVLASIAFYSMTWHELMKVLLINISGWRTFLYTWVSDFVDLIIPLETVSGELTKAYLVCKDSKCHPGNVFASVAGHRIILTFVTLGALCLSSVVLIFSYTVSFEVLSLLVFMLGSSGLFIAVLIYLCVSEEAAMKLTNGVVRLVGFFVGSRVNLNDLREKVRYNCSLFHEGIAAFGEKPRDLIKPIVYAFCSWLFHLSTYFLVFYALGFPGISTKISETIIVYSISMSVQTLPFSLPVGLVEIAMTSLYAMFGIPLVTSGTATTLIRVVTFWFQIMVGYIVVQWIGAKNILSGHPSIEQEQSSLDDGIP